LSFVDLCCRNQLTTIQHPSDCDAICVNMSDACAMWTFCASKKGSGQAPLNCFLKIDPFRGQNGWTGVHRGHQVIP
jgi:hypothetical protein